MNLPDVARAWQSAGVSIVPIVTKSRPAIRWKEFQLRAPNLDEIHEWWGNGHPWGIAIICGEVSGNLEMTELEARALSSAGLTDLANAADSLGCGELWDRLISGYTQQSPSGGLHIVYRITDHEVPGNEKIARREAYDSELQPDEIGIREQDPGRIFYRVLAETRGEGGYFVGAPSPGSCHPSGEPWLLASGTYGVVPSITWAERQQLHELIRVALDYPTSLPIAATALDASASTSLPTGSSYLATSRVEPSSIPSNPTTLAVVAPVATPPPPRAGLSPGATSMSPGDHWSSETDWADILQPAGWTLMQTMRDGERLWVRPGKDRRDGHSASTDYQGKPGFYVWSTSAGLDTEVPLTKLFIHAHYSFNGDMSACAQALSRQGYGTQSIVRLRDLSDGELDLCTPEVQDPAEKFSFDDMGNAARLWRRVKDRFRYVHERNLIYMFDGTQWRAEHTGALIREWVAITEEMWDVAQRTDDKKLMKWVTASRMMSKITSTINALKALPEATISVSDMDKEINRINLLNGEYNVDTKQLEPHDAKHYMTRVMKAEYNPQATCPRWTQFLEQVLPDEATRRYVQRAVGYTLLGRADQRAFFLIYGPSGTGKSQFLSALEYVFDQYGATAAEGTFRGSKEGGLTNDLHGLRGKRLVTTSETAENGSFNESLMKRLTGRDSIVSRELYQSNITWTPECTIWLATNHPPRFNSDDDAIWRRSKLVPFLTKFGSDVPEIPDYARRFLYPEADGILNWILDGLHDYLENGLGEPEAVALAAVKHREQSDSVVRFLEDQLTDAVLVEDATGSIRTTELYHLYEDWCRTSGEKTLGSRRFMNRVESSGRAVYVKTASHRVWRGLHRPGSTKWQPAEIDD